jgi:hypothetical protein
MKSLGEVVVALAQSVVPDVQAFLELYVQTSIYLVAALPFQFPLFFYIFSSACFWGFRAYEGF